MRNLKKILALVLALVMSFSLMATANAFTDDKDIDATYDEAVTVLSNLKVFQGYENGSFQPKGEITRAEVAAIIYRIVTGDVNDAQVAIYKDYNKFNDVKSTSWYAGYVNYCANAEYIKGYDAKTFGPNDKVTGYQALAMILRAVGYDVNDEFTGSGWQVKVASTANQLGLTRNITAGTLGGTATREVVAEVLFRTIAEAYVVNYTAAFGYQPVYLPTSVNNTGSQGNLSGNIAAATLGFQTFGLELTDGEISAVGRTAGTTTIRQVSVAANGTELPVEVAVTNTDTPWTDIGYQAYAYTVPTTGVKSREAVSDVVVTGQSLLATTDGTEYGFNPGQANVTVENNARLYYNGEYVGNILVNNAGTITNPANGNIDNNFLKKAGIRGVKVDYIDNDNGGIAEVVAVTEYTAAQVKAITSANTTTGINGDYETRTYLGTGAATNALVVRESNLVTEDELAVYDWTTFVVYRNDYYVDKAEATAAKYTARIISAGAETQYAIGDTNYYISGLEYVTDNTPNNGVATAYLADTANNISKDVTIYTDAYGYIVMAERAAVVNNYLYVISNAATNPNTGLTEAVVALSDGAIATVQIDNVRKITNANQVYAYQANALVGMHTYTANTEGTYTLGTEQSVMTAATYTAKTATLTGYVNGAAAATSRKVDLATVIVDLRDYKVGTTNVPVYTGYNEIPTVQNTVVWVNNGTTNSAVTVGFLLQNSNTVKQNFIVYQTTEYIQVIGGANNQTTSYQMDVLVGDTVSENYALTIGQFNTIQTYGVGLYSFISNDGGKTFSLVEYTAFDEVWDDTALTTWGTGVITWKGKNYTYDAQNLVVIDVGNKSVTNNLSLVWGETSKVYVANAGKSGQIVYAILGTEADKAPAGVTVTHPTQEKGYVKYTYNVATGYITTSTDVEQLYDVTVNGVPSWEDLEKYTEITLPKTAGNTATADEYVKIEVAGKAAEYKLAGSKYEVTADTTITTGYYKYTVDGEPCYTTAGSKNFATLIPNAETVKGTGSLWTFGTYTDAYVANASANIDVSAYPSVSLKTGYVMVKVDSKNETAKVTVNGTEVVNITKDFPVSVDDTVVAVKATGEVIKTWGPKNIPITADIVLP